MDAARLISPAVIVLIMALGCTDDAIELDKESETDNDTLNLDSSSTLKLDSNFQYCDSLFIATYSGTACCISGPTVARPGDIVRYHYQINHRDPQVSWEIFEGDISIIAGQNTPNVTVQFGRNFTTGLIRGIGSSIKYENRLKCNDRIVVTSD